MRLAARFRLSDSKADLPGTSLNGSDETAAECEKGIDEPCASAVIHRKPG